MGVLQGHVGEKPIVILYTYINRHAGTPNETKTNDTMSLDKAQFFQGCLRYIFVCLVQMVMVSKNHGFLEPRVEMASHYRG